MKTILNKVTGGRALEERSLGWAAGPPGMRLEVCQANSGVVQTG